MYFWPIFDLLRGRCPEPILTYFWAILILLGIWGGGSGRAPKSQPLGLHADLVTSEICQCKGFQKFGEGGIGKGYLHEILRNWFSHCDKFGNNFVHFSSDARNEICANFQRISWKQSLHEFFLNVMIVPLARLRHDCPLQSQGKRPKGFLGLEETLSPFLSRCLLHIGSLLLLTSLKQRQDSQLDAFKGFQSSMEQTLRDWKKWYSCAEPEKVRCQQSAGT